MLIISEPVATALIGLVPGSRFFPLDCPKARTRLILGMCISAPWKVVIITVESRVGAFEMSEVNARKCGILFGKLEMLRCVSRSKWGWFWRREEIHRKERMKSRSFDASSLRKTGLKMSGWETTVFSKQYFPNFTYCVSNTLTIFGMDVSLA